MKTKVIITIAIALLMVWLSVFVSRLVILSRLEYKRQLVHSMYVTRLTAKNKPELYYGVELEIAKYNGWLAQMKWLRGRLIKPWIPVEIDNEEFYGQ